ncbi:T9SS type A sorting domain-containing protein [bacterium]|nr:T9SS type A sorting domain-containing protein [bacterium]
MISERKWKTGGVSLLSVLLVIFLSVTASAGSWPAEAQLEGLSQKQTDARLDQTEFADWTILHSPILTAPVLGFGPPVDAPGGNAQAALAQVVSATGTHTEFELASIHVSRQLSRAFFRELRLGLPVLSGRADIVLNRRGQLMRWSLRTHDDWPIVDSHLLGMDAAATTLAMEADYTVWENDAEQSFSAWYPDVAARVLRPVYWIRVAGPMADERREGIVDAVTGEIIRDWPGIQTDVVSGTVRGPYRQPYDFSDFQIAPHAHATVTINGTPVTTTANGEFSREAGSAAELQAELRGPYVYAQNDDGPNGLMTLSLTAPFAPLAWEWTTQYAAEPELNLFYHTTFIHDWYKVLDPDFDALDYPLPAVANYGHAYDNAFWNGYGTYYGSGGLNHNFAMFSDVIYHEYTHGVTDGIYPPGTLPYIDQPGALNEAWSDYIAATINGDPYMAEWIQGVFNSWFRNLNNNLVYPRNWFGEVHYDSQFISAALWEMRQTLGAEVTDDLAHFARYALAETFLDYLIAVLEEDDDDGDLSNGTPHATVIYAAFGRHGIGPGDDPHFAIEDFSYYADGRGASVGDGDRFIEGAETIELVFTVRNDVVLFPPPATNVQVTVHSDDASLTIENGVQTVAELGPQETFSPVPVLIHVHNGAVDHWAVVTISISANGGSATFEHSFEFTTGTPHLLIVRDDPVTEVENFVSRALRAQDRIYDQADLSSGESLSMSLLPQPGLVIWLSGNSQGNIITAQDQALLADYITQENRVVLSGQNIADELTQTDFGRNVLQVDIESENLVSFAVTASSAPLQPGEWFLVTGTDGAANQTEETSFLPFGSSRGIATYGRSGTGPIAAVEFANGRGLLFGFGIEAVSGMGAGSTDMAGLMDRLFAWAADVLPVDEPQTETRALPNAVSIGPAYPNPFNGQTTIEYALPSALGGELVIFDLMGRAVESRRLSESVGKASWSPSTASGTYFAQIRWDGGQSRPIKLQFIR